MQGFANHTRSLGDVATFMTNLNILSFNSGFGAENVVCSDEKRAVSESPENRIHPLETLNFMVSRSVSARSSPDDLSCGALMFTRTWTIKEREHLEETPDCELSWEPSLSQVRRDQQQNLESITAENKTAAERLNYEESAS